MKKVLRTLMLVAAMLLPFASQAQLNAIYQFSTGVDNSRWYTLTSDSVMLIDASSFTTSTTATTGDSKKTDVTNIGFTFTFAGEEYTQFSANSDGTVRLGATQIGTSSYTTPFSASNANVNAPKICGLGCDGCMVLGDYIAYQLFGEAGSRVAVIEISTGTYNSTNRDKHYTFQIQLAEADNSVTVVYSPTAPAAAPAVSYQLGASANANDVVLFNVANNTMTTYTAGTGTTNASGTWPDAGRYYTITPNPNACYPVTGLAATNITTNGAFLAWSDAHNTGATYTIYNMTDTTVVAASISDTTYTLTGLTSNTTYSFAVVANCSAENLSNPAAVSFRTACDLVSLPWTCGFEENEIQSTTMASALPWCSSRYVSPEATAGQSYPYSYSSSTYAHNGSRSLYFYGTTSATYPAVMAFVLPQVDVETYPMNGNRLSFWGRTSSSSYNKMVYVYTLNNATDITSATLVDSVEVLGATLTKYTVSLSNAVATDSYVAIVVNKGTGSLYLDDMTLEETPSCLEVDNLVASDIMSNSITISWTDAANTGATYTVYDMATSTPVVLASNVTGTSYTATGLTPNTLYHFGIQANCATGDAPIMTLDARTGCAAFDAPYTWTFEDDDLNAIDPCWINANTGTINVLSSTSNAHGGSKYLRFSGSILNVAVLPETEDEISTLQLRFWTRPESFTNSNCGNFSVGYMTDLTNVNSFVEMATYNYADFSAYEEKTVTFAGAPAGARIAMRHNPNSTSWYWYVDDVTIEEAPTCLPVSALTASNVTSHSVTLSWTGTASGYTVYNMADSTAIMTTASTTVDINSLTAETPYVFGVAANCSGEVSSIVTVSVITQISCPAPTNLAATLTPGDGTVATLSWVAVGEETEWQICLNNDMANLISVYDTLWNLTGLTAEQAYTAKVRAICGVDDNSSWSSEITFVPTNAYMITVNDGTATNNYVPVYGLWVDNITKSQFIIPAANLASMQFGTITKLTFYASNANVSWGAATFDVYLTETTENTLSSLADFSGMTQVYAGTLSISGNKMEVTLTTPYIYMGGNLMVGFNQTVSGTYSSCSWYGISATGASMGGYGTSFSQQNFLPKTTINFVPGTEPDCLPVTGLTVSDITSSGATLTWVGDASSYTVYDMSDTTAYQNTSDTSIVLTGLTPMTTYTFGVAANCGGSESIIIPVTFATACSAVTLPYTETFEATSATRNCWELVSNNDANVGGSNGMGFVNNTLRFSSYSSATDYNQYGFSPLLNVSSEATGLSVKVRYATYGSSDQLTFGYITATDTVWETTAHSTTGQTDMQYFEAIVPATTTQLAVHYYGNYAYYGWIDSVWVSEITSDYCYPVTDLAVDSTTATSIFLSWNGTASSYSIYSSTGAVIATGITTTSYEITGLTPTTAYTFGVVANCGSDNSDVVTINATTACSGTTCFIEINGTDSYGDGWNGNAINIMQNGAVIHTFTLATGTSILSEQIPVCSDYPVSFAWVLGSYPDEVFFEIKNAGIISYTITNATSLTDGAVFHTINNACSGCAMPVVTVDTVTETSVTVSWTGTAISYDVYNDTTLVANVTTNSYTFTGLTPRTTYNFGVVAVCGVDEESNRANVSVVTTGSCPVYNLPFNETFSANSGTRNCWTLVDADNDGNNWTTMYEGVDNEMMLSFSYDDDTYTALTPDNWLISPKVHSTAGSNVTMSWSVAAGDANYSAEHYGVYVSTTSTDTSAFTLLQEWTLSSSTSNVMNLDLSAYAGQDIYVAFRHFNCTDMYVLIIDDVNIYEGAFVPDTLTVTFAVNDATMGTTTPAPGTYQYINGDTVQFSATPNPGYRFTGWAWTIDGETDTLDANYISASFPANAFISYGSMTFTALFEAGNPDSTTITYAVNDATMGTITPAPGTYAIYVGSSIDASASANAGYELSAWVFDIYIGGSLYESDTITADDEDFANPMHFGVMSQTFVDYNASIAITAVFAPAAGPTTYTVIVRTSNGEMGNVNPVGVNTVAAGETFTVTATPNTGYHFVNWTMGDSVISTSNPYTFTVTGDTYLTANFEANDSTVTYYEVRVISANEEMGTVSSDVPVGQVAEGTVMTVTATANEGYRFLNWVTDGGVVVSTENPYTFTVTANVNLVAMFERVDGIGDVETIDFNVYSVDNRIVVKGVENMPVYVYDVTGRTVKSVAKAAETVEFTMPSAGVYLVKVATAAAKRVVVVR